MQAAYEAAGSSALIQNQNGDKELKRCAPNAEQTSFCLAGYLEGMPFQGIMIGSKHMAPLAAARNQNPWILDIMRKS